MASKRADWASPGKSNGIFSDVRADLSPSVYASGVHFIPAAISHRFRLIFAFFFLFSLGRECSSPASARGCRRHRDGARRWLQSGPTGLHPANRMASFLMCGPISLPLYTPRASILFPQLFRTVSVLFSPFSSYFPWGGNVPHQPAREVVGA